MTLFCPERLEKWLQAESISFEDCRLKAPLTSESLGTSTLCHC